MMSRKGIFQAMLRQADEVERVVLTASGGPFRGKLAGEPVNVKAERPQASYLEDGPKSPSIPPP